MRHYLVPFLVYLLTVPILLFFSVELTVAYTIRFFLTAILLLVYWPHYRLRRHFSLLAIVSGIVIFILWVALSGFAFGGTPYIPVTWFDVAIKLAGMIILAPLIEELFTRQFLIRIVADKDWQKVPIGKFTWVSFIFTVLFFGFAHEEWLAGIITGIILNLLIYKTKKVESCILGHAVANLCLAVYVVFTSSWMLW
jgi:uncharacterized protein